MTAPSLKSLVLVAFIATITPLTPCSGQQPPDAISPSECTRLMTLHVDKQANPNAARLVAACSGYLGWSASPELPFEGSMPGATAKLLGGSDLNLVTGDETFPAVTQAGSMVWGNGSDIVAVYNDTRDATASYSGMSVSTDGGINFDRLNPGPFGAVFGGDVGSPAVAYDDSSSTWLAITLAATCGGQGIGLMSSVDPSDPASWSIEPCAHSGLADDRPIVWIDNNPVSANYGRVYIAFNDFDAGGALKVVYNSGAVWNEVTVDAGFIRNVHITGSSESDGTVFIFGMNEGGGAGNGRINIVYRSTDGGASWTSVSPGPSFPAAGAGLCAASTYFYMIPPVWRHMGWGQGAVGPDGVVHYVFCRAGQVPGDLGDIYYIRSIDNGITWSSPMPLNTDQAVQNNVVQWLPSISVTSQGYVLATWYDRRNTTDSLNYEYYGRLSLDNGATFLPDEPISDGVIPQPTQVDPNMNYCFAGDSNLHGVLSNDSLVTWTDGRNAISDVQQMDVYFDRVALCPSISVSPVVLPNGQLTLAYSETVSGAGGTDPYTFTLSGSLPPDLVLDGNTGDITGTPTTAGTFPFAIVATDSLGCDGPQDYSLIIDPTGCPPIALTPTTVLDGTQGAPYLDTVTANGGTGPYLYAVTAGALPNGLTLDPNTGDIAGTPTESGAYPFNITATDSNLCNGTQAYTLTILCSVITLSPPSQLPDAFAGVPYLANITANGGTAPYKYEVTNGTMHNGIFFGEGGSVFGVTESGGTKIFRVQAVDVNGCMGDQSFRMDSVNCFPGAILCDSMSDILINFTPTDLCNGEAEWYGTNACMSSGDIGHTPSAHARWGINPDCNNYGAGATQDSLDSVSVDVSNCNSGEVILRFNYLLSLEDEPSTDRARVEVIADGGAAEVVADNGAGGPTCSGLASPGIGNLKTWSGWQNLELIIPATSTFQVNFIGETDDGDNNAGEGFFVDDVIVQCKCAGDMEMAPDLLPPAIVNVAYSVTFEASGGMPPYTYDKLPGFSLPPGLGLNSNSGELSGIPTTPGIFEFYVEALDSNYCQLVVLYSLIISPQGCPTISITPETVPEGEEGAFYSELFMAAGGTEPYVYTITAGGLPPGLALDPNSGAVSGTPTTAGIFDFAISAVDFEFCIGSQDYTIIINPVGCPAIDISPPVLPNAESGVPYSETLTATGGVAPYLWFITAGAMPDGLTLDQATGEISGIPVGNNIFSFAVTAQDSVLCTGTAAYGIDVINVPPRVTLVHTVADTGDGQLVELEATRTSITQIYVTFHEEVYDPVGDTDPDDVTNPANYLLVTPGADGVFDTTTCLGGLAGDDQSVTVDQVAFDLPSTTARLRINGGVQLLRDWYRLLVCGTTSIVDLEGEPLDGNGDGIGGDDFELNVAVSVDNLFANPNLDDDLTGWTASSPTETTYGTGDADSAPTSGSVAVTNLTGTGHTMTVSQCVAVSDLHGYFLSGKVSVYSGLSTDPTVTADVVFYDGVSCSGSLLGTSATPAMSGDNSGGFIFCDDFESGNLSAWGGAGGCVNPWGRLSGWVATPTGAISAEVRFVFEAGASPDFTANLDNLLVFQMLFGDGFESGDTSAWSGTVGGG